MFDVAFSELVVIAVVALIVIGPEKLPKVARTLGFLAGRMQRYVSNVKADIEREMQFEDLQKLQQEIKENVMAGKAQVLQASEQIQNQIHQEVNTIEQAISPASTTASTDTGTTLGVSDDLGASDDLGISANPSISSNPSKVELASAVPPATSHSQSN